MNKLTKALLGGAALSVLTATPLAASPPRFHVQALHGGRVVKKAELRHRCGEHVRCLTYTFAVSTSVAASDLRKTKSLANTFYKWCSTGSCITEPKQRIKAPKKSVYGNIRTAVETYSFGGGELHQYYGDTYKLTDKSGFGKTDTFVSTLKAEWDQVFKYKGTLNLDVSVIIESE